MVSIHRVSSVNNYVYKRLSFQGNSAQMNPQTEELTSVTPDFSVKTPIKYTKIGEMNFPYDTKAYCYKLSNGQKIIIVPHEGETVLRTYVNTGSMNEPDNIRGISHYIEHNLFNGSKGLGEGSFFKQVNKMGASANASTGFAETNYYVSSNLLNKDDLENEIKLHATMLETPLFATEKLEKEKDIVNSEINMITSSPDNIAVNKMLKNLYGIKTASTDMIGGTTDNITKLTHKDITDYYKNNYYPANMVTVISGNVNPDETMKLISKYFTSTIRPSDKRYFETLNPIQNSVREDIISDKATASTIVVGFNGANNIKDRIYLQALSRLLSLSPTSRIDKNLQKYNSSSFVQEEKISINPKDNRAIIFLSNSNEENCEKVLKTIFMEIGNIANNPPTDKELKIIKKFLLKNFAETFETSFSTNNAIGTSVLEGNVEYFNNFENIVNSMTTDDLVNTAKKYLDVNKASVTIVHPSSASENSIKKNYSDISFTGLQAIKPENVKEYNLNNNYKVITQNSKTNNAEILFKLSVNNTINTKPAASIILQELLNEGSAFKDKEQFKDELAQDGIEYDFSANEKSITCSFECDNTNISKSLKSIREVLNNPRFTEEKFTQAKDKIKDNILTSEKSAFDKLNSELFKGLPEGYTKEEILEDLETVSLNDIKELYNKIILNGKGVICISAPFDKSNLLKYNIFNEISKFMPVKEYKFEELPKTYFPIEKTKVLTDTNFKNQAEIIQAYKFKRAKNLKDEATFELLNIVLGSNPSSRLFTDLREKEKLAYRVSSNLSEKDDAGCITLKIDTTTDNSETGEQSFDNIQKSLEGFKRHINKIKSEKVTEEELNNAKLFLKNILLNNAETASERNFLLIRDKNSPYGIFKVNQLLKEIENITVDDIYNAANYIFSGKPVYSILATKNSLKANEEYLKHLDMT